MGCSSGHHVREPSCWTVAKPEHRLAPKPGLKELQQTRNNELIEQREKETASGLAAHAASSEGSLVASARSKESSRRASSVIAAVFSSKSRMLPKEQSGASSYTDATTIACISSAKNLTADAGSTRSSSSSKTKVLWAAGSTRSSSSSKTKESWFWSSRRSSPVSRTFTGICPPDAVQEGENEEGEQAVDDSQSAKESGAENAEQKPTAETVEQKQAAAQQQSASAFASAVAVASERADVTTDEQDDNSIGAGDDTDDALDDTATTAATASTRAPLMRLGLGLDLSKICQMSVAPPLMYSKDSFRSLKLPSCTTWSSPGFPSRRETRTLSTSLPSGTETTSFPSRTETGLTVRSDGSRGTRSLEELRSARTDEILEEAKRDMAQRASKQARSERSASGRSPSGSFKSDVGRRIRRVTERCVMPWQPKEAQETAAGRSSTLGLQESLAELNQLPLSQLKSVARSLGIIDAQLDAADDMDTKEETGQAVLRLIMCQSYAEARAEGRTF